MRIELNGKALLSIGLLSTGLAFGEYVSIINSDGYTTIENESVLQVIERKETSTGGYTIWSDGYKEAWGQYEKGSNLSNGEEIIINLPFILDSPNKTYYNANIIGRQASGAATINVGGITSTTASFLPDGSHSGTLFATGITWTVKGY